MSLSSDPKKWKRTIEASGVNCLTSSITAKNVQSTLSRATTPGAQKILCSFILPFIPEMLKNSSGISILTSLVRYGTLGTVEKIAREVMKENPEVWCFIDFQSISPDIIEESSDLLDAFVYRTDASGGTCDSIRENLKKIKGLGFQSKFTLPALGRLLANDVEFSKALEKDKSLQEALGDAIRNKTMKITVKKFCENALERKAESGEKSCVSEFLFKSTFPFLKKSSPERPHEGFLLSLVSMGDSVVVEKVGESIKDWGNIRDLAERVGYTNIFSALLERGSQKTGVKLLKKIFNTEADVDNRLSSKKGPSLRLLSIVAKNQIYLNAVNESVGMDLGVKLRGASALFLKSTTPMYDGTRKLIEEKLSHLQNPGNKRPRE